MVQNNPLFTFLDSLLLLYPSKELLLIGAGNGSSLLVEFLMRNRIDSVTLVEPQDGTFRQLEVFVANILSVNEKWILSKEVIAKASGQVDFYYANKHSESGLVDPNNFREIWPNLRVEKQVAVEAISLNELCGQIRQTPNWLMIDSLGTLQVLDKDSDLSNIDVVVVRVIFDSKEVFDTYTDYSNVCDLLNAQGFKISLKHPGQHPNIGYAVFVKDFKTKSKALTNQLDTLTAKHEQIAEKYKAEQAALREAKQANEAQVKQQVEASKEQEAKVQALQQQLDTLTAKHEQIAEKYKAEQAALREAKQANEAQVKQQFEASKEQEAKVQELQQQLDALNATNNQLIEKVKSAQAATATREISKDKDIDDFINDISPYFYGRTITYVDVGACYGDVFLKFYNAKNIKMREAHLYEPNPENFAKLTENISVLKTRSLHAYNIGIANSEKSITMSSAGTMTKAVSSNIKVGSTTGIFEVNCSALDSLSDSITDNRIDLLKIDVEGSEIEVLEGAKQLLSNEKIDVIYIEVGFNIKGSQQVYFAKVDALLQKYHYRCFKIYEQKNEWIQDSPLLRRCNFAYMSRGFAKSNPYKLVSELYQLKNKI